VHLFEKLLRQILARSTLKRRSLGLFWKDRPNNKKKENKNNNNKMS